MADEVDKYLTLTLDRLGIAIKRINAMEPKWAPFDALIKRGGSQAEINKRSVDIIGDLWALSIELSDTIDALRDAVIRLAERK